MARAEARAMALADLGRVGRLVDIVAEASIPYVAMQAEAGAELGEGLGVLGELGEELQLDCAEEGFGAPEAHSELQDMVWPWFVHRGSILI